MRRDPTLVTVPEAARLLGVSVSTVWRRLRRAQLPSQRRGGRRMIPARALRRFAVEAEEAIAPLTMDHPIWAFVGAARSGGEKPGASDIHAMLDDAARRRRT